MPWVEVPREIESEVVETDSWKFETYQMWLPIWGFPRSSKTVQKTAWPSDNT